MRIRCLLFLLASYPLERRDTSYAALGIEPQTSSSGGDDKGRRIPLTPNCPSPNSVRRFSTTSPRSATT